MLSWLKRVCGKKEALTPPHPHNLIRRTVDTQSIRNRLQSLGWSVMEHPIRTSSPDPKERKVVRWKLIASRGDKSFQVEGKTIDEAMNNLGTNLGVIARN